MREIAECILRAVDEGRETVLVSVVAVKGSAPRHVGSQMLVSADGLECGTIGGGAVEAHGIVEARAMAGRGCDAPRVEDLALKQHGSNNLGMACGGDATLLYTPLGAYDERWRQVAGEVLRCIDQRTPAYLALRCPAGEDAHGGHSAVAGSVALYAANGECLAGAADVLRDMPDEMPHAANFACLAGDWFVIPVPVPVRAVVFGGGHVGRATVEALSRVGFSCTLFDNRSEFADPKCNPAAAEVVLGDYDNIAGSIALDARDYVLIMTSGHVSDIAVLGQALRKSLAYVGMIGSRKKIATARKMLLEQGISEAALDTVHMPIGLDIQAETPEEIAVSIAAECIQHRARGSKGQSL